MRIVHFADLHLDAPFRNLPVDASRARRQALRRTLEAILELARRERADAVFSGGDLFEHDRVTADTQAFLRDRLGSAGVPVFLAPGNHDWLAPTSPYLADTWPANVHVFTESRLVPHELTPGLVLHGAAHRRPSGTGNFLQDYAIADRTAVHIGLFHASERGGLPYQGADKAAHAPFDATDVTRAGLHHAFLGHYHVPSDAPTHTYPGNPDPLSFGEEATRRGAVIADITSDGVVARRWRTVAQSNVHAVDLTVDGCEHRDALITRVRERVTGLSGAIRLRLRGNLAPEVDIDPARDLDPDVLGIERTPDRALVIEMPELGFAYDLDRFASEPGVRGELVRRVLRDPSIEPADRALVLRLALNALAGRDDLGVL